jgi:DNA-binding LytR/AlgR family response regulator
MKVLIIEDEPFARQELIRLLNNCDETIEIVKYIDSVEESVNWLRQNNDADLILMDIQLSDGLSFEIFSQTEVKLPVIFTTAYDEYAIRAFKVNSIDYLLKPIDEDDLMAALQKFKRWQSKTGDKESYFSTKQLEEVLGLYKPAYKTRLVVKLGDKFWHVEAKNTAYFYSEDKVSFLITNEGKKYIVNYTLEQIEKMMNPNDFFRLNRKYLANIKAIESIDKYFNSRLIIGLKPQATDEVIISRTKVTEFLNWLER